MSTSPKFVLPETDVPTTPLRFLGWLLRHNLVRGLIGTVCFGGGIGLGVLMPWMASRAIDDGILAEDWGALGTWAGAIAVLGLVSAAGIVIGYRALFLAETYSRLSIIRITGAHLSRLGATVNRQVAAGEVVNIGTTDARGAGNITFQISAAFASLLSIVLGAILVWTISPLLAVIVVVGVTVVAVICGPLLNRLRHRQTSYREQVADLTTQAADVVGGLRVLRGIGGEAGFAERYRTTSTVVRDSGFRVARTESWVQGLRTALPMGFVAVLTWVGTRMAAADAISVGELIAAYGYAAVLVTQVGWFIGSMVTVIQSRVAAGRITRLLRMQPDLYTPERPLEAPPAGAELHDPETGLRVSPGKLTVLVASDTDDARAALDRIGYYVDSDAVWGGVKLAELAVSDIRARILIAENTAYLFAGTLRQALDARDDDHAELVLKVAVAADVRDSLGGELDSLLPNGARNLSGGQRQRLRLARALAAEPEFLLAREPTSAVDAHTEATIAERLSAHRAGRTTVIVSASPLWLAHADQVVWLSNGQVRATGSHGELVSAHPGYRRLTSRNSGDNTEAPQLQEQS